MRHKADIEARKADWANQFDHIWATKKENRLRCMVERYQEFQSLIDALYEEARQATEAMKRIDPDAADVPVNSKVFWGHHDRQQKILRDIADELGQLMSRSQADNSAAKPHLYHSVEGVDLSKALGLPADSHGTNAAYKHGCVCRECREHQRIRMAPRRI